MDKSGGTAPAAVITGSYVQRDDRNQHGEPVNERFSSPRRLLGMAGILAKPGAPERGGRAWRQIGTNNRCCDHPAMR